ncbi:unnamed protein product [Knipowitschia caucasica]
MEVTSERQEDVNTGEFSAEDKATVQTPDPNVNGLTLSTAGGRVLRDRSTRTVPAWLKEAKSEEENDEVLSTDTAALKRRKVSNGKRKKLTECAQEVALTGDLPQTSESQDQKSFTDAPAPPSQKPSTQTRAKPGRAIRGANVKLVCKTEPTTEGPVVDEVNKFEVKKKEEEGSDVSQDEIDKEPQFEDLTNVSNEDEEADSSEEDVPFRDDLNDQSYDPKEERECPKPKRRLPPRQREKQDKEPDKCPKAEKEIKKEGTDILESADDEVKVEEKNVEEAGGSRKRGRRKKDDKTPRLPKRRKKPPVQYVRCEMEGCGTVLAHPRYLQHHIKYQHLLKKKYVCPHPSCGRLFRLQKQLLRHAKHHTDQRDYICEYCARAFKSSHNLAVHRMIHTGEKPLQCEICGFTCRQKASLNWHMKKHDADATYQFSCSICGKKFEKKDCVVAHKAKSHPEVLIAEALAANADGIITTPASLLELQGIPTPTELGQIVADSREAAAEGHIEHMAHQVGHQVVVLGQEQNLHEMQVPVTIALSPIDPPSPAQTHLQLQVPVQFVQGPPQPLPSAATRQQPLFPSQQSAPQAQILQMTFQPVSQLHLQTTGSTLVSSSQSQITVSPDEESFILENPVMSSTTPNSSCLQQTEVTEDNVVWEHQQVSSDVKQGWCTQAENTS